MAKGTKTKDSDQPGETGGFEKSLERLEEIVAELEGSDVPLERALALFEEGVTLGRACSARLDAAERRITVLLEQADGALVEKAFDAADGEAPASTGPKRGSSPPRAAARPVKAAPADDDDDDSIPF